jgi:hypothetical protein
MLFSKKFLLFVTGVLLILQTTACVPAAAVSSPTPPVMDEADLSGIHSYLMTQLGKLSEASQQQKAAAEAYYQLAAAVNFDYAALLAAQPKDVVAQITTARSAWKVASPLYEQIEGIVAGVPTLSDYDVILDAGGPGSGDPENAVPFDLTLPDGRVLPKPGNLYGVLETTLWGTNPTYTIVGFQLDLNNNGAVDFGEALPDANVLKGAADLFDQYLADLVHSAQAWQPTPTDAFTALVVMVPTMNEYFESWKNSRFVAGANSTQMDFAVISRLADIQDILSSLQIVYAGVAPLVKSLNEAQAAQIGDDLAGLKEFVAGIYAEEQAGRNFTAEEAEVLGAEAQARATSITGQIAQAAAALNISIEE